MWSSLITCSGFGSSGPDGESGALICHESRQGDGCGSACEPTVPQEPSSVNVPAMI
jgi:hypothetical protein